MNYNAMVALTDYEWYDALRENPNFNEVNFWTPTPWNIRKLKAGGKVYFLLKARYGRMICGYGKFSEYKNLSLQRAWKEYGQANGVHNYQELIDKIRGYTSKNSKVAFQGDNHTIGCIILHNIILLDKEDYFSPSEQGWEIPKQVVTFKYLDLLSGPISTSLQVKDFELISKGKNYRLITTKARKGQSKFRADILSAYDFQCCITSEKTTEVLEAAHIQEYISESSNNIQNGLLPRADFHDLFDSGLITISEEYTIIVSEQIRSAYYRKFHGSRITLPKIGFLPSKKALRWHYENLFRK